MESEVNLQPANQLETNPAPIVPPAVESNNGSSRARVRPAVCATCGAEAESNGIEAAAPNYVFAIGRVEMRFPTLAIEKEFAQATGRSDTKGLSDRAAAHAVLSARANRYIARQVCWFFTIEGLETYILVPRDPADYDQLLEAVRAQPSPLDLDVVVGVRGRSPRLRCATASWFQSWSSIRSIHLIVTR